MFSAIFWSTSLLKAITPPNADVGSDSKAFEYEFNKLSLDATPQGFACLTITQVGSNCGAIGQHAAVFVDGAVYWMGKAGGFFVYDGTVKRI